MDNINNITITNNTLICGCETSCFECTEKFIDFDGVCCANPNNETCCENFLFWNEFFI